MKTIKQALINAALALQDISDSARLDAELLLQFSLGKSRTYLFTYPERALSEQEDNTFNTVINKRMQGMPIAYITGEKEFWSLTLKVSQDTLIPRPDTEILVETALQQLKDIKNPTIIELGTGSGAIAIALATERSDAIIYASDISNKALAIAEQNIKTHHLKNITLLESNWFQCYPDLKSDIIISNPPYIATDCALLEKNVKDHEPNLALFSQENGYKDLLTIIKQSKYYLRHQGHILLEHGMNQEARLEDILKGNDFCSIKSHIDLQGIKRIISAQISDNESATL